MATTCGPSSRCEPSERPSRLTCLPRSKKRFLHESRQRPSRRKSRARSAGSWPQRSTVRIRRSRRPSETTSRNFCRIESQRREGISLQERFGFPMSGRRKILLSRSWFRVEGFDVSMTRGNHLRIEHPDLQGPVFAASTPSDWRAERNLRALLRRRIREAKRAERLSDDVGA